MNALSLDGQGAGARSAGSKQRVMAAVDIVGLVMKLMTVSIVVLSNVPDGVSEVVEATGLMLNAGTVMVDSVISSELSSSPISVVVVVSVTMINTYGFDRLSDILAGEKADKDPSAVFVAAGAADVKKQPRPIGAKSRQTGTFGGQHCGGGEKTLVQVDEMSS